MKILSIRINNLASLEGVTEIDFTTAPLNTAGIFAITGPTGAGKSTILDALCLALYAKTPRYLQAKETGIDIHDVAGSTISQGDVRGILRDGTAEGYAAVDFQGVDGQHYRSVWQVRRSRNRAEGSIQAYTMSLKNLTADRDIPGRKTELLEETERLIGLSFEQFTRSVLLAQGDFTAFLKAGKDEKSSLLEKLTGTHIYSGISKLVFEKHKKEEQELRELQLKKESIVTLTEEEVQALHEIYVTVGHEIKALENQILILNNEISWHRRLKELQSGQAAAASTWREAKDTKEKAAGRAVKLQQTDEVQITRTWVDALQLATRQQERETAALTAMEEQLILLDRQQHELEQQLQTAAAQLTTASNEYEAAMPELEEAKKLDILLAEKQEQAANAFKEAMTSAQNHATQLQQLQQEQVAAETLTGEILRLTDWKTEHSARQPVAANRDLIVSKLADAQTLLNSLQPVSAELATTDQLLNSTTAEKKAFEQERITQQQLLQTTQQAYERQNEHWPLIPLTTLESGKAAVDSQLEDLIRAQAQWHLLYHTLTDLDALKEKLEENIRESTDTAAALATAGELLATAQIKKETAAGILATARIAATENVTRLRAQLVAGDPCPVCGSCAHPYHTNDPLQDHILQQITAEHLQYDAAYLTALQTCNSLQERIVRLEKTADVLRGETGIKETALQQLLLPWTTCSVYAACAAVPDEEKSGWLQDRFLVLKEKQSALQQEIQDYHHTRQQLEAQKRTIDELEKIQADHSSRLKDLERTLGSLQEKSQRLSQQQQKEETALSAVLAQLTGFFSGPAWIDNWKKEPAAFLRRINDFAELWLSNTEKLDQLRQQQQVLSVRLSGMALQLGHEEEDARKKEHNAAALQNNCREISAKRATIFQGLPVSVVLNTLKGNIEKARALWEHGKAQQETARTNHMQVTLQKGQQQQAVAALEKSIAGFTAQLEQWLTAYNGQHETALDQQQIIALLRLTPEQITTERTALRHIDDAVTAAYSVLTERNESCRIHELKRHSVRSEEELDLQYRTDSQALDAATRSKNEVDFKLQHDIDNKKRTAVLAEEMNAQAVIAGHWGKLNEVIGSADGKKFRQVAQEYTLDVLLGYANNHLSFLAKRYRIQRIPGSLGLQVTDQDMGDEIRTVYSLSGGESFLVSLALALGLAALSASRMKVESLFIDEGFGALDPATLNIAMDALERLQHQGRIVGVISHVREMTERIPVQIRVSKLASGKSKVTIYGAGQQ